MKKKILYLVSEDWYFLSHRLKLALSAKKQGYQIHLLCRNTGNFKEIEKYGINCYNINWNRRVSSPLTIIKNVRCIRSIIFEVKPNIVHFISLLPILLGMISIFFNRKIKIIVTITGLGTIFIKKSLVMNIIRFFIQIFMIISFKRKNISIIVQNKDDQLFCNKKLLCSKNKIFLIRGSGVNIFHHVFVKEPNHPPVVLAFVGRLLEDKGLKILIDAFELALKNNSNLKLLIAGSIDQYNPTAITKVYLNKTVCNKKIEWLKEIKDVREVWKKAHIAVLPSRREGLPMSLMEAAANGRAIISTDVPGCREIAINQVNAILVPTDNVIELSKAIIYLSLNHAIRKKYGFKSREIVESDMSEDKVIHNTLSIY